MQDCLHKFAGMVEELEGKNTALKQQVDKLRGELDTAQTQV